MPKVIIAETQAERDAIYRFRYQVYVEEMQKRPNYADHQAKTLSDPLDETATLFYVMQQGQIIATLRRNWLNDCELEPLLEQQLAIPQFAAAFSRSALSYSSRLMVAPAWRNSLAIGSIILAAYRIAREQQIQFDFLHTAPWLLPFYRALGYRHYLPHFLDRNVGVQIPQLLVLEDVDHLQVLRSPLYRLASQQHNRAFAQNWFQHCYGDRTQLGSPEPQIAASPLFRGLSSESIMQFSQATAVYKVRAGETILQFGDVANALFTVLSGEVALSYGSDRSAATLSAHQTFGETNLFHPNPSQEQAVALTETDLLIFPKPALTKLVKTAPELVCHILLQASRSVCNRYIPTFNLSDLQHVA